MMTTRSTTLASVIALSLLAGCATVTKEQTGAIVGGAAGAVIGAQVGEGSGRDIAIALGAIAGSMIGAQIGRYMDEQDRINTALVLEKNRTGETSTWKNPDTGNSYAVTPTRTYEAPDQGPCREFTMDAEIGGDNQQVYGTACREPDGSWNMTS